MSGSVQEQDVLARLGDLRAGCCGVVRAVAAEGEDGDRLKSMGICENRKVMLVQHGDPLILRVLGSRIGLSARLADQVHVLACPRDLCNRGAT